MAALHGCVPWVVQKIHQLYSDTETTLGERTFWSVHDTIQMLLYFFALTAVSVSYVAIYVFASYWVGGPARSLGAEEPNRPEPMFRKHKVS